MSDTQTPVTELTARHYFIDCMVLELGWLEDKGEFMAEAVARFRRDIEPLLSSLRPEQLEYVCDQLKIHNRQAREFLSFRDNFANNLADLTKFIPFH